MFTDAASEICILRVDKQLFSWVITTLELFSYQSYRETQSKYMQEQANTNKTKENQSDKDEQ